MSTVLFPLFPEIKPTYWLSYGGGVNSTALLVMLASGKLPQYEPWRAIFSDTGNEKENTYHYVERVDRWLEARGLPPIVRVYPKETVLERWQRLSVTGNRLLRSCTDEAKIRPIEQFLNEEGQPFRQIIGIAAEESHRARDDTKIYPLVDLDIDREECTEIIKAAGLCVPEKSGCWHCPFARVNEILRLSEEQLDIIEHLENEATRTHGGWTHPDTGEEMQRTQWDQRPVSYWRARKRNGQWARGATEDDLDVPDDLPCGCVD